ncbi:MAG TPA: 2-oxoglutarate dehydrogenase E1 component [Chitinophagaceae bacterium]|nr:2-oxoglutarate dehydrogenase E1 component [Chitinophagaceae bacterium]
MEDFSYITSAHPSYIESLYTDFVNNPDSVDEELKKFFEGFDFAITHGKNIAVNGAETREIKLDTDIITKIHNEIKVYELIRCYRKRGHLLATTNPLGFSMDIDAQLDLNSFRLTEENLKQTFFTGRYIGLENATLEEIIAKLKKIYTGNIGIEYTYINRVDAHIWVRDNFEAFMLEELSLEETKRILEKLNYGVIFEKFLATKYIGQKRFGLEGGESMIPALDAMINTAAEGGAEEIVIGMAHRGRLNVLTNIMRKTYDQVFSEFEGNMPDDTPLGGGDVKYHLGFRSTITSTSGKEINVQLLPNPSHLEAVNSLVAGYSRGKSDILYNKNKSAVLPIIIHGDAAIAGQGVVYELLQMSKLDGYKTDGTVHFIINNQIGFTTDSKDARSSIHCTSIASLVDAPVLHVNGDDPEAVVKAAIFAIKYRQKFKEDIFIDMVSYRKHGHNEGDEPKFTQPKMYSIIEKHEDPRTIYTKQLIESGKPEIQELAKELEQKFWDELQARLDEVKQKDFPYKMQVPDKHWNNLKVSQKEDFESSPVTGISEEDTKEIFYKLFETPEDLKVNRRIKRLLDGKVKHFDDKQEIDWATGELLAYASIVKEGKNVRVSGEDVKRGTFSHRHAVLVDENTNKEYNRISAYNTEKNSFEIYNSLLSEYAVLGFEYGYSLVDPNNLVIWEAQFGDFVNVAQVIIDQYISSAEQKWGVQNGLTLLLPHGYEGGGPDHSSAYMERFLQLAADENMFITNVTTAANFFHLLRRQLALPFRKPLINFSPKANLRQTRAYSTLNEFVGETKFTEIIDDSFIDNPQEIKRVLLCSGKVYYDLSEKQIADNRKDIAIIRLEQIYPIPEKQLLKIYEKYRNAQWVWVQEEPRNKGAASFLKMNLNPKINLGYLTRQTSASSATGFGNMHKKEQEGLINQAFSI